MAIDIVEPERDMPGMSHADEHRTTGCQRFLGAVPRAEPLGDDHPEGAHNQRHGDHRGRPPVRFHPARHRHAENDHGNRPEDDEAGNLAGTARRREELRDRADHRHQVAPEEQDDGDERAGMQRDIEGQAERPFVDVPAEEGAGQHEVGRARHRQELGQPLDAAEQDGFDPAHINRAGERGAGRCRRTS
jgi:hypothetical protein